MVDLVINKLVKTFGDNTVVDNLSLHVADGEFVSLLGPSGCGKSTTLAAIAGLDKPTSGEIRAGNVTYYHSARGIFLPPEARGCGLVFQSYALWPHMTVFQNVAFPLKLRKVTGDELKRRVMEVLELVEMAPYADRHPHQLSGGQQQRVALARTLGYRPALLLLDEPLSNLDAKLRDRARVWLAELRGKLKVTTIYVTHDQVEALSLSDRIVVMNGGKVAQVGTPQEIYETPADPFVADFIGTTNFMRGKVGQFSEAKGWEFRLADGQTVSVDGFGREHLGREMTLALRPAQLALAARGMDAGSGNVIRAQVLSQSYVGSRWQLGLQVGGDPVRIESDHAASGSSVDLFIPRHGAVVFAAQPPAVAAAA
ncbi:MAG: ABC transporter ATP-binding protein [Pseudomonadota bacterium]